MSVKRGYAAPHLLERERRHRRTTLIGVALLLLFITSPVFGHHLADPLSDWLAGRDHFFMLCVVALHELMEPVHRLFHILLVVGLGYGIFDRMRATLRMRETLRMIESEAPSSAGAIATAAAAVGVPATRVRQMSTDSVPAFTAGLFRPVIYVNERLEAQLSPEELRAVIAHEDAHRRRRDPLRLTVWRFLGCTLFFLPALRRLVDDMADEAEIAADDAAASDGRVEPLALASALIAIADGYRSELPIPVPAAVGLLGRDLLERRVRRLAGEPVPIASHLTRRSLTVATVVLAMAWISGLLVAHPLPPHEAGVATDKHSLHCSHHVSGPLGHLFCRGLVLTPGGPCPHVSPEPTPSTVF
jgi:Zn-dependent protease with chaperone function